ncbi:MAG: hypothetical protein ACR2LX_06565 [Jatrophihabitans sp.]
MTTIPIAASLFLARRWLRSKSVRRSAIMLAVTFAVLGAVFVCVNAFTLTGPQQADRQLGKFQQSTYTNIDPGTLGPRFFGNADAKLAAAVSGAHLMITTPQLTPDSYTKSFVTGSIPTVAFTQDPGLRKAFPGRYTLKSGAWPQSQFDVAISGHLAAALGYRAQFTVLSGHATFHVVGIVNDAYAEKGDLIIAGPGTWESIPRPDPARSYQPVQAQLDVLWSSGSVATVQRVLQAILSPIPPGHGDRASEIDSNYATRSQIAHAPVASFGSNNIVVSYLPLLLAVLLMAGLVVRQTRTDALAGADRLVAVGIARSTTRLAQIAALMTAALASIAVGLGVGWLIGIGLRASVLPHYDDQPLSPLPGPDGHTYLIAAAALLVIAAGTLWPARRPSIARGSKLSQQLARLPFALIRRAAAVVVLVVTFKLAANRHSEGDTALASYLTILAVMLLTPDVLRIALAMLSRSTPRTFVTRRLMSADLGRHAAAAAVVVACISVPICAATQIDSQKLSRAAGAYSLIPPHQMWVQSGSGIQGVTPVGNIITAVPHVGHPVVLRGLAAQDRIHNPNSGYAHFLYVPRSGNFNSYTLVLSSADDLRRFVGSQLPAGAEATLNAGGVLDFTGTVGDQRFVIDSDGGKRRVVPQQLRTLHVSLTRQFSEQYAGVILLSTAKKLNLPISDPTKYIFTNVPTPAINTAVAATVDAGYDSRFVQYNVPPPPPDIPTQWYVFLAGLIAGAFVVLLLVIRSQAKKLRTYSSRLLALGLTARWTLSVLGIQAAIIVGIGLLAGVAAGVLGIALVTDSYLVLNVPSLPIALACGATIVAAGLATASAVRALTAVENPEVN